MTIPTSQLRKYHRTHAELEADRRASDRALDDVAAYRKAKRIVAEIEAAGIPLDIMTSAIEARRAAR